MKLALGYALSSEESRQCLQGGAMWNSGGSVVLIDSSFSSNFAASGGAIFSRNGAKVTAINCTFYENQASQVSFQRQ